MTTITEKLTQLGAVSSISEDRGLALITDKYLNVFSPGISTGAFAEIKMAIANPKRHIIATTIDEYGVQFARENIKKFNLENQIEVKLEDLTKSFPYKDGEFDFIYARLVLHYLEKDQLDSVLAKFDKVICNNGLFYIVVRSDKNIPFIDKNAITDQATGITTLNYYDDHGNITNTRKRYFLTMASLPKHLAKTHFEVDYIKEYQELIYKDFARKEPSTTHVDYLIECLAKRVL